MYNLPKKRCAHCEFYFYPQRVTAQYCSDKCRYAARNALHAQLAKAHKATVVAAGEKELEAALQVVEPKVVTKVGEVTACVNCRQPFKALKGGQRFCSKSCTHAYGYEVAE